MERRRDPIETLLSQADIKACTHLHSDTISDVEGVGMQGVLIEFWSLVLRQGTASRFLTEERSMTPNLEKIQPHTRLFISKKLARTLMEQLQRLLVEEG